MKATIFALTVVLLSLQIAQHAVELYKALQ